MKGHPSEPHPIKKLPLSVGEFPKENWCFIEEKVASEIVESGESKEALFYEGARTLLQDENLNGRVQHFLQSATEGHFPNFPFLMLPTRVRQSLVAEIRDPKNSLHIGPRFTASPVAVKGIIQYALEPNLEIHMEQIAYEAASEVSNKIPDSDPREFMPPGTAPERAVQKEMIDLMASDDPGIDRSRCSLTLEVDFTRSPTEIVKAFEKIILQERSKWKQPVTETRGKAAAPYLHFRDLAVLRLFERCKSVNEVCKFLDEEQINSLEIYKSPKGWNDARTRATKRLDQLKQALGAAETPSSSSTKNA